MEWPLRHHVIQETQRKRERGREIQIEEENF